MATVKMGQGNFEEVVKSNQIVLVDFWAPWCGPCRAFAPVFEKASEQHPHVIFAKVDTEAEPQLAAGFGIMSIPTLMAFRDQVIVYAEPGALPRRALDELIGQVKDIDMDEVRRPVAEQQQAAPARS
ncbi:MAG TPA: thioredoxin [Acidimicrobiales bacterium]|nr:thioredoxin [Acidimicrobiales bacterium]